MNRLISSLAFVVFAAGVRAFAQQSGGVRVEFQGPGGHSFNTGLTVIDCPTVRFTSSWTCVVNPTRVTVSV